MTKIENATTANFQCTSSSQVQYAFLDSGVGGLPYLQFLCKKHPASSCLYVADTKHFPYGEKTKEEVIHFSKEIVQKIIEVASPSVIIIACNTMTVCALDVLRHTFDIPFVGTVPAIKTAANLTQSKNIALIGTKRTVEDEYIRKMNCDLAQGCSLFHSDEGELVKDIEEGLAFAPIKEQIDRVLAIVKSFEKHNCDTLILGCTHFLHLRSAFIEAGKQCTPTINIVDSLEGVVRQALRLSPCKNNVVPPAPCRAFYASGIESTQDLEKYDAYSLHSGLKLLKDLSLTSILKSMYQH